MKLLKKLFWVIVIVLLCIAIFEFYRVRNGLKPMFCIQNNEHLYQDGITNECIGLGYKVYEYKRTQLHGIEFVSIFAEERDVDGE